MRITNAATFADAFLIAVAFCCFAVSGYYTYLYDWTQERVFVQFRGRILYEFLPLGLGILFLFFLRFRLAFKINVALVLLSTLSSLYTAELLLPLSSTSILWFNSKPAWEKRIIAQKAGVNFDPRSRLQVIRDLREKGVDAVPNVPPATLLVQGRDGLLRSEIEIDEREILPLAGVSHRLTVLCNESGDYTLFDSDEYGFANPTELWRNGRVEIAAVGDSFTQGSCVPSDKNFVALIRKGRAATLNLGGGGNGPLLELATLKEYAAAVKPRLALWFYFEDNDLTDLSKEKRSPLLMRYLTDGFQQGLLKRREAIDRVLFRYIERAEVAAAEKEKDLFTGEKSWSERNQPERLTAALRLTRLRSALGLVYGASAFSPPSRDVEIELFRDILKEAKRTVNGWGGSLYFVYLPAWQRYGSPAIAERNRDRVMEMVKGLGLPLIDIHPVFKSQSDPLVLFPFRQPAHYNVRGNELVASAVLRSIER